MNTFFVHLVVKFWTSSCVSVWKFLFVILLLHRCVQARWLCLCLLYYSTCELAAGGSEVFRDPYRLSLFNDALSNSWKECHFQGRIFKSLDKPVFSSSGRICHNVLCILCGVDNTSSLDFWNIATSQLRSICCHSLLSLLVVVFFDQTVFPVTSIAESHPSQARKLKRW